MSLPPSEPAPPPHRRTGGPDTSQPGISRRGVSWRGALMLLPLAVFSLLAVMFFIGIARNADPSVVPSPLVGRPAPQTVLPPLPGLEAGGQPVPGFSTAALAGQVSLVNVWASWCAPCRLEHPVLTELARDPRLVVAGISYKDVPANALRFLGSLGNPYAAVGLDRDGRAAIEWGVYGVPETYLIGRDGTVRFKVIGPLDRSALAGPFGTALQAALAEPPPAR